MADDICVCGHPKSKHTGMSGKTRYCMHDDKPLGSGDLSVIEYCPCHDFRPVLPWPDSEGWWWCDVVDVPWGLCHAFEGGEWITTTADDIERADFEAKYGPARFTKLLERNPLVAEQED